MLIRLMAKLTEEFAPTISQKPNGDNEISRGVLGVVAPVSGFIISRAESLELWLRVSSLAIGCLVGLATLFSLCIGIHGKLKGPKG